MSLLYHYIPLVTIAFSLAANSLSSFLSLSLCLTLWLCLSLCVSLRLSLPLSLCVCVCVCVCVCLSLSLFLFLFLFSSFLVGSMDRRSRRVKADENHLCGMRRNVPEQDTSTAIVTLHDGEYNVSIFGVKGNPLHWGILAPLPIKIALIAYEIVSIMLKIRLSPVPVLLVHACITFCLSPSGPCVLVGEGGRVGPYL